MTQTDVNKLINQIESSSKFKKFVKDTAHDSMHTITEPYAKELESDLNEAVSSSRALGVHGISALEGKTKYKIYKNVDFTRDTKCKNQVHQKFTIFFTGNLSRESVAPDVFDKINNIAALLNNGYTAKKSIVGKWKGKRIHTVRDRTGAEFVEEAAYKFRSKHPKCVSIEITSDYAGVNGELYDVY